MSPLPQTFDPLFRKYAGALPITYLRALTKKESNFDPRDQQGAAWGLMQVTEGVRESHNKRHGTAYARSDLLHPEVNVKIAADLINRIAVAYEKHADPNLKPDWQNPEFVALVTAGWNSGYSEAGGVGRVAKYLESRGIPVTHANVFRHAASAGATRHLSNSQKATWQQSVTRLFFAEGGDERIRTRNLALAVIAVGAAAWGIYRMTR